MKQKRLLVLLVLSVITFSSIAQENEKRFGFELSSGASLATNKLSGSTLNPGLGFEGIFHYRFLQHTGVYAGWGGIVLVPKSHLRETMFVLRKPVMYLDYSLNILLEIHRCSIT